MKTCCRKRAAGAFGVVLVVACGGQATGSSPVGVLDAGADGSAEAGGLRQVDRTLLRGPCSETQDCPSGQACARLNRIDPSLRDPICVASDQPCRAVICEQGRICSFGDEMPYPMICINP